VRAGFGEDQIVTPELDQSFELTKAGIVHATTGARRIAPAQVTRADWHNARVRLLAALNDRLEAAPDDAARERLIAALSHALQPGEEEPSPKA
jgi:metallo-beta-lactamase family protein